MTLQKVSILIVNEKRWRSLYAEPFICVRPVLPKHIGIQNRLQRILRQELLDNLRRGKRDEQPLDISELPLPGDDPFYLLPAILTFRVEEQDGRPFGWVQVLR